MINSCLLTKRMKTVQNWDQILSLKSSLTYIREAKMKMTLLLPIFQWTFSAKMKCIDVDAT